MKKFTFNFAFLVFMLIYQTSVSQNLDDIFDDDSSSNNNKISFSTFDFLRGIPSIAYSRVIYQVSPEDYKLSARIGIGVQMFDPILTIPYYTNNICEIFSKMEEDDLSQARYFELGIVSNYPDYYFGTDNELYMGFIWRHEVFDFYNDVLRVNSYWLDYGYDIVISSKYHIMPDVRFGLSNYKYKEKKDFNFNIMVNIEFLYSF